MKLKKLWKAGVLALAISAASLAVLPVSVSAASILDELTDEETMEDHAEDTSYSLLRGVNLNYGTTGIAKLSSNQVSIAGITQCHRVCGTVYLTLALERKTDGVYSTYKIWNFTANNVTSLSRNINVIVPSGYYYRTRGYHAAQNETKESTTTLTQGVLIQ